MKQVILDTTKARSPREVYALLERERLEPGDDLKVVRHVAEGKEDVMAAGILVLIAVLWYMSRTMDREKRPAADAILNDVFGRYDSAEQLEKELREEYDISVVTEMLPSVQDDWSQMTMTTFAQAAYADDEPDISHIAVREPNPAYRPWKKDAQCGWLSSRPMAR